MAAAHTAFLRTQLPLQRCDIVSPVHIYDVHTVAARTQSSQSGRRRARTLPALHGRLLLQVRIAMFQAEIMRTFATRGARCPLYHGSGQSAADLEAAMLAIAMIPDQNLHMAAALAASMADLARPAFDHSSLTQDKRDFHHKAERFRGEVGRHVMADFIHVLCCIAVSTGEGRLRAHCAARRPLPLIVHLPLSTARHESAKATGGHVCWGRFDGHIERHIDIMTNAVCRRAGLRGPCARMVFPDLPRGLPPKVRR